VRVSGLWQKFSLFYKLFIRPPKRWRFPQRSDILLYDGSGLDVLMPYLKGYSLYVHYIRGEVVNVPCLVRALFDASFWLGNPLSAYGSHVLKRVAPKVAMTFIDNNPRFYMLSDEHPGLTTVFVQNGIRGGGNDVFGGLTRSENYRVDHMLVFNRAIAAKYSEYIAGETLIAGSLKNNHCNGSALVSWEPESVLFVSQYRRKSAPVMYTDGLGRPVHWDDFYALDRVVVQWLGAWCLEHGWKLLVCGCAMNDEQRGEESWYESILGRVKCSWEYLAKKSVYDSYQAIEWADIVVAINSTLGYEAFARGKKTAFLTGRGYMVNDRALVFAWPAALPDFGPFWSNKPDKSEFLRIMDYLTSVSDHDWKLVHEHYRDDVMVFDPGNTILTQLLAKLLLEPAVAGSENDSTCN